MHVQELCRQYGATFIIDDRVDLVKEIGADGVHLGKLDMPIKEARKMLGKGFIIGGTANTFADIRQHVADGADYIGCGPFRFTTTKQKIITHPGTGWLPLHPGADERRRSFNSRRRHWWNYS